jgi:hypothetical protein
MFTAYSWRVNGVSRNQQKGTSFESSIAKGLATALDDDRIERRARTGAKDKGDVAGVRLGGRRIVLECKNEATGKVFKLPEWVLEAQEEARNDKALVGLVVHKRSGTTDPLHQWVTCTVGDLVAIIKQNY